MMVDPNGSLQGILEWEDGVSSEISLDWADDPRHFHSCAREQTPAGKVKGVA